MSTSTLHNYPPYRFGGVYYIGLLVLSLIFYKERTLFADIPFHIFYLLQEQDYAIQNQRFGAFITQTPPLLALKSGASLQTVAFIYSATFALLYMAIFGLLAWMKNVRMAMVMLLLSSLMVADTFFWIQSELPQGLSFLVLTYGILTRVSHWRQLSLLEYLLLPPLLVMLAYFHPLLFIPFTFVAVFLYLDAKRYQVDRWLLVGATGIFGVSFILKNTLLKAASEYESRALQGLNNFVDLFPNYFFFPNSAAFFTQILTTTMIASFIGLIYWYTHTKNHRKLLLLLVSVWGYWTLITVTQAYCDLTNHYMENLYLPLSIILAVPLAFDLLPALPTHITKWLLASVLIIATIRIVSHSTPYRQRRYWQRKVLEQTAQLPNKKLLIKAKDVPKELLLNTLWSSPYEFWMLSSIERPHEPPRSIIIDDGSMPLDYFYHTSNHNFGTYWGAFPYSDLDCRYFNCSDTSYYVPYVPNH